MSVKSGFLLILDKGTMKGLVLIFASFMILGKTSSQSNNFHSQFNFHQSSSNGQSSVIYNYNNGKGEATIIIDGKPINLNETKVVKETATYKTYESPDFPNVKITKFSNGAISIISNGGSRIELVSSNGEKLSPEEIQKKLDRVNKQLTQMNQNIHSKVAEILSSVWSRISPMWG